MSNINNNFPKKNLKNNSSVTAFNTNSITNCDSKGVTGTDFMNNYNNF